MSKNLHFKSFFYMIKPCCHIYPSNPHGAIDLSLAQLFPTPSQKASGFAVSTVLGPPAKLPPARWLHRADGMVQFSTTLSQRRVEAIPFTAKPCLLPWDMATFKQPISALVTKWPRSTGITGMSETKPWWCHQSLRWFKKITETTIQPLNFEIEGLRWSSGNIINDVKAPPFYGTCRSVALLESFVSPNCAKVQEDAQIDSISVQQKMQLLFAFKWILYNTVSEIILHVCNSKPCNFM